MNKIEKELKEINGDFKIEAVKQITNEIFESKFVITELNELTLDFCRKHQLYLLLTWVDIDDIYIETSSELEEESNSLFDSSYSIKSQSYFKNSKVNLKTKLLTNF